MSSIRRYGTASVLALALILSACGGGDHAPGPEVALSSIETSTGTFQGVPNGNGAVTVFKGIRYSAAPVGALRWRPPQPLGEVNPTPIVANTFGAMCPQRVTIPGESEDCLFLNVYVPKSFKADQKAPVMVYIHGGAFVVGQGAGYDPTPLSSEGGVIVVTINYRLGVFGFLDHAALASTAPDAFQNVGDAGNYGTMDQQFALHWVQANIGKFGGDPSKVTIFGESAGSLSVMTLVASPDIGAGLFRAAIPQSGGFSYDTYPKLGSQRERFSAAFESGVGCASPATADCLRGRTKEQIMAAQESVYSRYNLHPQFGTKIVPRALKAAFTSGQFNKVPVLQGTNAEEGRFFVPNQVTVPPGEATTSIAAGGPVDYHLTKPTATCGSASAPTVCTYPQAMGKFQASFNSYIFLTAPLGADLTGYGDKLAALYPKEAFKNRYQNNAPNASQALSRVITDSMLACPVRRMNVDLSKTVPVYQYELDDPDSPFLNGQPVPPKPIQPPNDVFGFEGGSAHLSELPFIFDVPVTLTDSERALGVVFRKYLTNFATSLDPNKESPETTSTSLVAFTPFPSVQKLQPGAVRTFQSFDKDHQCSSFWDQFSASGVIPAKTP